MSFSSHLYMFINQLEAWITKSQSRHELLASNKRQINAQTISLNCLLSIILLILTNCKLRQKVLIVPNCKSKRKFLIVTNYHATKVQALDFNKLPIKAQVLDLNKWSCNQGTSS